MRLDSNTRLDCEHGISPSDTYHQEAESYKIARRPICDNQSVQLTGVGDVSHQRMPHCFVYCVWLLDPFFLMLTAL